jgi:pimeloyl-ACP methyl ester carboxylesterase
MNLLPLVGRERELGLLDDLVDRVGERGGALVVSGEAGIGKSALLAAASRRAGKHGMMVLTTAGVQTEAHLPFAGLHQLLEPVLAGAEGLPARQRAALLAAFGMADAAAPDLFLIGLAALELLADAAARSPLLLIVEDAQWLDRPTGAVLAFVARRLESEPIVLLTGVREGYASALGEAGLPELRLEGLGEAAAGALLASHAPALAPRLPRLALLIATSALLVFSLLPVSADAGSAGASSAKPTIVLVHGAWADGSSWNEVTRLLQRAGYLVLVPPNPLRSLSGDAAYISAFIQQRTSGPVVLVGHSYGGAVITNAGATDPDVRALVYINGFAPDQGENVLQLANAQPGSELSGDPTTKFDFMVYPGAPAGDFDLYVKQAVFPHAFANDLPAGTGAVLAASQRPITLSGALEPSGPPAWKTIPSWYLVGRADNVLRPRNNA